MITRDVVFLALALLWLGLQKAEGVEKISQWLITSDTEGVEKVS